MFIYKIETVDIFNINPTYSYVFIYILRFAELEIRYQRLLIFLSLFRDKINSSNEIWHTQRNGGTGGSRHGHFPRTTSKTGKFGDIRISKNQ